MVYFTVFWARFMGTNPEDDGYYRGINPFIKIGAFSHNGGDCAGMVFGPGRSFSGKSNFEACALRGGV